MWGAGIAEMMFDSQDAINACERAKMDNMALSSRPQVVVYADRLVPGHNHLEIKAGKIWPVNQSEVSGQGKPIEFFVPECRLDQIKSVQQDSINFAQEQTAMPNFLMGVGGDGVHNRTLGGASMQFNAAITPLKGVVMNFENYLIIPLVQKMCDFYHQYDKTEAERGDYKVNAKGVSGLMAREVTAQRVAQVMQIAGQNPDWARRTNLDRVYNLMLKDSGLSSEGLVLPDEVVQQRMQQEEAQKAQMQMAVAQQESMIQQKQRAETAPKDALIEAMKQATESSLLKTILIKKVLEVEGLMDEEIMTAFQHEADLQSIKDHDSAELIGQAKAERQPQIVVNNHPAPPKSISVKRDANGNIIGYERVMAGEDENV